MPRPTSPILDDIPCLSYTMSIETGGNGMAINWDNLNPPPNHGGHTRRQRVLNSDIIRSSEEVRLHVRQYASYQDGV